MTGAPLKPLINLINMKVIYTIMTRATCHFWKYWTVKQREETLKKLANVS